MILLVDLGNSRIKWATVDDGTRAGGMARAYERAGLQETLDAHWSALPAPRRVILCNVAGRPVGDVVAAWVREHWDCPLDNLRSAARLDGVSNAYPEPARLGIDRLVAMVGAHALYPGPVCVVDVGTALTLDALDADGRHLGGLIAAGPGMMLTALGQTGDILMDRDGDITEFATATPDAVASGVVLSGVALVERFVSALGTRVGKPVTLVVTGGAADRILPHLKECRHEPDLVLEGLAVIAREDLS